MVNLLETKDAFDAAIADGKVAVDFTATWCGPCKRIGPVFERLAGENAGIKFFKVDVDKNADAAEAEGITAMPTFKFYHGGKVIQDMVLQGASEEKLKEMIQELNDL